MDNTMLIRLFLEKLYIQKYEAKLTDPNGSCKISTLEEFSNFVEDTTPLKQLGMTNIEAKRFKRLCNETIQEILQSNGKENAYDLETWRRKETVNSLIAIRYCILSVEYFGSHHFETIKVDSSQNYSSLIKLLYLHLKENSIKDTKCESIELYSETGYPIVTSPANFLKPIRTWFKKDNEMIYIIPKMLGDVKPSGIVEKTFRLKHKNSDFELDLKVMSNSEKYISDDDISIAISFELYLPRDCFCIYYKNVNKNEIECWKKREHIELDEFAKVYDNNIYFSINKYYWEPKYINAFYMKNYIPSRISISDNMSLNRLNGYLLYLARDAYLNNNPATKNWLGYLRRLTSSPPLVYALYLLFQGKTITLPHKVAIMEGFTMLLSHLAKHQSRLLENNHNNDVLRGFEKLWKYIVSESTEDDGETEYYEHMHVSDRTRENPRNDEVYQLIVSFPEYETEFVRWRKGTIRDCANDKIYSANLLRIELGGIFEQKHGIEILDEFMYNRCQNAILLSSGVSGVSIYTGCSNNPYKYFKYFSPDDGKEHNFNPHEIHRNKSICTECTTSICRKCVNRNGCQPRQEVVILLDGSYDMCDYDYSKYNPTFEPNLSINTYIWSQFDVAILLIETIVDMLIRRKNEYLLTICIFFHDENRKNCRIDVCWRTLHYLYALKNLYKSIKILKEGRINDCKDKEPRINYLTSSEGCLSVVLEYILNLDEFSSSLNFICLSNCWYTKKYTSSNMTTIMNKMKKTGSIFNCILFGTEEGSNLRELSKSSNGKFINNKFLQEYIHQQNFAKAKDYYMFTQYESIVQDYILSALPYCQLGWLEWIKDCVKTWTYVKTGNQSAITTFEQLVTNCKDNLIPAISQIEEWDSTIHQESHVIGSKKILRKVTEYLKFPHPYIQLYSVKQTIMNWIITMQGPKDTPYEGALLVLGMILNSSTYPMLPPTIKFLTTVYHPNVELSGKICHSVLFERYRSDISLKVIFTEIYEMLKCPINSHSVRGIVLDLYLNSKECFSEMVKSLNKLVYGNKIINFEKEMKIITINSPPKYLICDLTNQLFQSPVVTPYGYTYEKIAILSHIKVKGTDPKNGKSLKAEELAPNEVIIDALQQYKQTLFKNKYWWDA